MIVFARKGHCTICSLEPAIRDAVNRAMWTEKGLRRKAHRTAAITVSRDAGVPFSRAAVENHVRHVEASLRTATEGKPAGENELALIADFKSVTAMAAGLGVRAMEQIGERLPYYDAKETIAVAKLGVNAVTAQEASRLKGNEQKLEFAALFGLASRHLTMPEEAIDVTPVADLRAELERERTLLTAE